MMGGPPWIRMGTGSGAGGRDMGTTGECWALRAGLGGVGRRMSHDEGSPAWGHVALRGLVSGEDMLAGRQVSGGTQLGGHQTSWCQGYHVRMGAVRKAGGMRDAW